MKIKQGFVSNSSSSSFIMLGINLNFTDTNKLEELFDERILLKSEDPDELFNIVEDAVNKWRNTSPFNIEIDHENKKLYIGKLLTMGDGYSDEIIEMDSVIRAYHSQPINFLKDKGYHNILLQSIIFHES